ncbi:TolC family protein [Brenneria nigrifluens]|uniref:TolC family protein n=1 Tax=Brenneria nigrifluens DSM 30175 = ATCC 13028 TaxID=1121120 RepID=A0A2U1URV9_9GAMM|nr:MULTISPECIES: TolC family protein [Brenneria]PWC24354.1 TolC family protein [Brenneria nigrifluens] [Brenneria nigrifluens DSM 30175 = ATCC 13028]QCR07015.1 TolC family protein [Brenneria nigrifluens] [Brenneria nigrifluens DSM 30175 = ATCC 13028]
MGRTLVNQHIAKLWDSKQKSAGSQALKLAVTLACLGLAGCAVKPEPVTTEQQVQQALSDRTLMFANQEPVRGTITLDESIARALKYNLQQRVALMEQAMEDNLIGVASLDMLPKLAARAGLQTRNNVAGSSSESVTTGEQSLEASTSQDKTLRTADLSLSWNVLDFGISYFNAKMQANKSLAAEERRRRVVADITRQVRTAYWEAATAQRLQPEVTAALVDARQALEYARQTERQRLLAPVEALRFQKNMLEMVRQLEIVDSDLVMAKSRLASLMNLPPASKFDVSVPSESSLVAPKMAYTLDDLENFSMVKRPEVREESYLARNSVLETRKSLLRLLPGVSLFAGINGDSNSYLVNRQWASAGLQVSGNLLNVLSWSPVKRAGEANEELAEARRQALRMAVLTQVNVAWQEYQQSTRMFSRYQELARIQRGILNQTELSVRNQAATQMEQVRVSTETILTTRARDRSFADVQNALGAVYQAAGLDVLPDNVSDTSLAALSNTIARSTSNIETGGVPVPRLSLAVPAAVAATAQPAIAQPVAVAATPAAIVGKPYRTVNTDMWDNLQSLQAGGSH